MLNDHHIVELVDFANADDCFPGVDISGGVLKQTLSKYEDNKKDEG